MASNLFNLFGGGQSFGPFNNMMDVMNKFNSFKRTYSGGDPKQAVQSMLQSGQMSQEQFNKLSDMANKLRPMMK